MTRAIVVRGAKAHQTGAVNSHWILVMPTIAMSKEDADYAVSFVCPADEKGVYYIYGRQSSDTRKMEGHYRCGECSVGGHEALMVFDNVFIPWENVLMCGNMNSAACWWNDLPAITARATAAVKSALATS